jgi:Cu/Ag efflux pump CusA
MIATLIRTALRHRWLVLALSVLVMGFGVERLSASRWCS